MELLQLTYFCDAAKSEKFSATARKFMVPTSNISQSVKRLERELGVELFEHRANRVRLLDAGRCFYEKASAALLLLEEAKSKARGLEHEPRGEIKLLVSCNRRLVTSAIEAFKTDFPQVNFVLRHDREPEFEPDIVVTDQCPKGYGEVALLAEEEILLAMPKDHILAQKPSLTVKELQNERFISMPNGRSLYLLTEEICRAEGFSPNISIQTDDPHYVRKYVALGLGIAFVPAFSWEGLYPDHVILRRVGEKRRKTYICLPKSRSASRAVSEFLNYLQDEIK